MSRITIIAKTVWLDIVRRKDIYVVLILLGVMLVLLSSLSIFGLSQSTRYVADVGLLFTWLFGWILMVHTAARELPHEEKMGTIYSLLAKPVTRIELILGKWLGTWSVVSLATLLFYVLVAGVVTLRGGRLPLDALLQAWGLHALALGIMAATALAFSTRMHHDAAATLSYVITAAAFLVVPRVPQFMTTASGLAGGMLMFLYNALPHFELFDLRKRVVHHYGPMDTSVFLLIGVYALAWIGFILLLAWLGYRHKRFTRETHA